MTNSIQEPASRGSAEKLEAYNSASHALKRLLFYFERRDVLLAIQGLVAMFLFALTTFVLVRSMEPLFNIIIVENRGKHIWIFPAVITGLFFIRGLTSYGGSLFLARFGHRIVKKIQTDLFKKLAHADLSYFIREPTGKLVSFFGYEMQPIRQLVIHAFITVGRDSLTFVAVAINLIYTDWQLTAILLTATPLYLLLFLVIGKHMNKATHILHENVSLMTSFLDETFKNMRQIKALGAELFQMRRARTFFDTVFKFSVRSDIIHAIRMPLAETLAGGFISLLVVLTSYRVLTGTSTVGAVISFLVSTSIIYRPLRSLLNVSADIYKGTTALNRVFFLIDQKDRVKDAKNAKELVVQGGEISLSNVCFSYQEKSLPALDDISVTIPAGQTVALVGSSGAGKSTVFNLILRFFNPDSGQIKIDGQDIALVTQKSLRNAIGVVFQDIDIFNDTIAANISYGDPSPDEKKIRKAAQMAEADEFINRLPEKYNTTVGERGVRLSGGQRQRVALARNFYRQAPILFLDEATSALDNITENAVKKALERLHSERTILIIAHRFSTIKNADLIILFDEGKIMAKGTHKTLLTKSPTYRALYESEGNMPLDAKNPPASPRLKRKKA